MIRFFVKLTSVSALSFFLLFSSCKKEKEIIPADLNGMLFINEVYAASGEDWLEIYNDADEAIDLSGFFIYDDETNKYKLPTGTTIASKGFLVLICDDLATGLHTNFKLSSGGETITFEDDIENRIDQVTYPALGDFQSYARFPDGSSTFAITSSATQGTSNGSSEAPVINEVSHQPLVPGLDEDVTVSCELLSTDGITSVQLFYRVDNGAFNSVSMSLAGQIYTGVIPALNGTGLVEYYVTAENSAEKTTQAPNNAPTSTYSYLLNDDPLPQLFINEFMAFNSACCPDTVSGEDEFDDWIEIYNAGAEPVDIADLYVSDNKLNPFKYRIPDGDASATTIPAGGFLILWADGQTDQGELHLDFALANAGEDVGIYYFDGRPIDEYTFAVQTENSSWGLTTDGGDTWQEFTTPTPGASNE